MARPVRLSRNYYRDVFTNELGHIEHRLRVPGLMTWMPGMSPIHIILGMLAKTGMAAHHAAT